MNNEHCQPCSKYISWSAILGGAIVALGLTFLFNLLTIAMGLSLFTQNSTGKLALTFAGFAWILIGVYIILFLAGWVSGRIVNHRQSLHCANGFLHGFLTWTVYLIISLFMLSNMASDSAAVLLRTTIINSQINDTAPSATISSDQNANQPANVQAKETRTINKAGWATFATFFIFFVGALGCCIGACYGIRECRKCNEQCASKPS